MNADVAYTLDGAERGEIVYETFSADKAAVHVQGVSIHPGQAKDKLVNALHLAAKIVDTLPQVTLTPETTAGREGFIHIYEMSGTAAAADLHFILRDFERDGLRDRGALIKQVCATLQATEPRARITCTITPQYRNMRYWLENDMRPVELAREACRKRGIEHFSAADPRRHRRLASHRDGRADAESLHRDAEHPRTARMGQRPGHEPRHRDVHRAGEVVEPRDRWRGSRKARRRTQGDGARRESSRLDWLAAMTPRANERQRESV